MVKHPAGPFTVRVHEYSLGSNLAALDEMQVYSSRHRSPQAAYRRLAQIIASRTVLARQVEASIARGKAGKYVIETGDGTRYPLKAFNDKFCS